MNRWTSRINKILYHVKALEHFSEFYIDVTWLLCDYLLQPWRHLIIFLYFTEFVIVNATAESFLLVQPLIFLLVDPIWQKLFCFWICIDLRWKLNQIELLTTKLLSPMVSPLRVLRHTIAPSTSSNSTNPKFLGTPFASIARFHDSTVPQHLSKFSKIVSICKK